MLSDKENKEEKKGKALSKKNPKTCSPVMKRKSVFKKLPPPKKIAVLQKMKSKCQGMALKPKKVAQLKTTANKVSVWKEVLT